MSDAAKATAEQFADAAPSGAASADVQLDRGTYEIIRQRLDGHAAELKSRLERLNEARRDIFGSIETKLLATERITTTNNCIARDMVAIGGRFLFGYNVHLGLKTETDLADVLAVHRFDGTAFSGEPLDLLADGRFENDFKQLYKYYKNTTFSRFHQHGPALYLVFQVGKSASDIKSFKWLVQGDALSYVDNRSDHEVRFPPQHEFEWTRTHRDLQRKGMHPHISIEDRLFVECVGGDLTIKIEDNTDSGEGIFSEPVDNADQTLDDAEIFYASLGNIILLKIRPYQEKAFRYITYNEKVQKAIRIDAVEQACVLLPEDHGVIFSSGYLLQTGEHKTFDSGLAGLMFDHKVISPNGEDVLYVFYHPESGQHVLLSYNLIEQRVDTPIVCHGYALFETGKLLFFKAVDQAQKHHAIQVWQTPYLGADFAMPAGDAAKSDSLLFKIGNRDVVRAMAECHEIIGLTSKDDTYANLYVDVVKLAGDVLDTYHWLGNAEACNLAETLGEIRSAAAAAVDEFDKVVRVRRTTQQWFDKVAGDAKKLLSSVGAKRYEAINDYVTSLAELRRARGDVIGLRDLRYVDRPAVDALEKQIGAQADKLAAKSVEFLLKPDALATYEQRIAGLRERIGAVPTATEAKKLDEEFAAAGGELEMLIDVVGNLKIDDATRRTAIIDNISTIYSQLNQARAELKRKAKELLSVEGVAEFAAQIKLLGQAVTNYLELCNEPRKCDEYLTKVMVQIEELEGRFAEFDEFIEQLAAKRDEVYTAFDSRKVSLVEAQNKRAASLLAAADRIIKGIATRVGGFKEAADIHAYFAADLMIEKVRDLVRQLGELGDSVKVDEIQSRLKTVREDALRQLKDRKELFVDGQNAIRLGKHSFTVNTQTLDLTTVLKGGRLCFHLAGTNFIEPVTDETMLSAEDLWDQEVVSESDEVYRGEYLAYRMLRELEEGPAAELEAAVRLDDAALLAAVQQFMSPRYAEGYVKGVHDQDAAKLLKAVLDVRSTIGLLRFHPRARALAMLCWLDGEDTARKKHLATRIRGAGAVYKAFPGVDIADAYVAELRPIIAAFVHRTNLFPETFLEQAAEYLFEELSQHEHFALHEKTAALLREFNAHLDKQRLRESFTNSLEPLMKNAEAAFVLLRDWVGSFLQQRGEGEDAVYADAVAVSLQYRTPVERPVLAGTSTREISGLLGQHATIDNGTYRLDYNAFRLKLRRYERDVVPRFEAYHAAKKSLLDTKRNQLKLEEFKPRVLTSFVRNRLLDQVLLPVIGDNLAKQIGVLGEEKRTDLMGLLLLVSPPGYGKTTLMEYIANRLGITFVKINGPAIGHGVTSLDPAEAPNAGAREEVNKLNLALEMGDNVMLYVDDIQHCNPEFLQKFISLCDAQRKIEGVYQGRTRTYDLRGRKVCVVMAGNPYTESGEKFKIPDMLANRADVYNLGDIAGGNAESFRLSYLENSLTSNAALSVIASRSHKDVYGVVKIAQTGSAEGVEWDATYSNEELADAVAVMKKLFRVRDVLLRVNEEYIRSAAQADEFRTEPAFKLQGSYRDMNKLAERVVPVMNDAELSAMIDAHYRNQAQTLTTGAEANLLKFKVMFGQSTPEEAERWENIGRTYQRNQMLRGVGSDDKTGLVIAQLTALGEGLTAINKSLGGAVERMNQPRETVQPVVATEDVAAALAHLEALGERLSAVQETLAEGAGKLGKSLSAKAKKKDQPAVPATVNVVNRVPRAFLDVIQTQFQLLYAWMRATIADKSVPGEGSADGEKFRKAVDETMERYQVLIKKLEEGSQRGSNS
ncbi:MAG: DNA repair ATPase [Pirellulales bacterium]